MPVEVRSSKVEYAVAECELGDECMLVEDDGTYIAFYWGVRHPMDRDSADEDSVIFITYTDAVRLAEAILLKAGEEE